MILLILTITIPRWAATLAQVDKWSIWGVPITAIGEGIALELACYYIVAVYERVNAARASYAAWWADHDKAMAAQGKKNHKPKTDPELRGAGRLMVVFYILFVLTVGSQTPFIMAQLTGEPVNVLLTREPLWGYAFLLVVSPEIVTIGLAMAIHFDAVARRGNKPEQHERVTATRIASAVAMFRVALFGGRRAEPIPEQPSPVPVDGTSARDQAVQVLADDPEVTGTELAKRIGRSPGLARRYKREILGNNGKDIK